MKFSDPCASKEVFTLQLPGYNLNFMVNLWHAYIFLKNQAMDHWNDSIFVDPRHKYGWLNTMVDHGNFVPFNKPWLLSMVVDHGY